MPYIDPKDECIWRWKNYGVKGDLDIYDKWLKSTTITIIKNVWITIIRREHLGYIM